MASRGRIYFNYHFFNNAPTVATTKGHIKVWGDPHTKSNEKVTRPLAGGDRRFKIIENNSPFPSKAAHDVLIQISTKPASREVGTRVASSLEQLLMFLRQDGFRATFNGTFVIEDVSYRAVLPSTRTVLSQRKVLIPAGASRARLPVNAPHTIRELERALLGGGFLLASYVEGTKRG